MLSDFWLPIILAVVGIGGTIFVTVVQLRARRAELDDDRRAREAAALEARREAVIEAVYDSVGAFTHAASITREQRRLVPVVATAAIAKVVRVIRLSGRTDRADLHEWFALRSAEWGDASVEHDGSIAEIESTMLGEIDAWFDGRATAAQIRAQAERSD